MPDRIRKVPVQRKLHVLDLRIDPEMHALDRLAPAADPVERGIELGKI